MLNVNAECECDSVCMLTRERERDRVRVRRECVYCVCVLCVCVHSCMDVWCGGSGTQIPVFFTFTDIFRLFASLHSVCRFLLLCHTVLPQI
jgi:hypothetical protein